MRVLVSVLLLTPTLALPAAADEVPLLLRTLQAAGPKAAGAQQAARAWEQLVQIDADQLPTVLAGLDGANPLAANWIRTAVDAIAEGELRRGGKLPAAELERFVLDARHGPKARRLAYEWLLHVDRSAAERLLGGMLNDSSLEMRRDAVARLIDRTAGSAGENNTGQVAAGYRKALTAARDSDQIRLLTDRLRKLGQEVDVQKHFGFIARWKLIGPFDNTSERGYDVAYPPEREFDLAASHDGKHGKVGWIDHVTKDDYGKVDFNKALAEEKAVIAYATTDFFAEKQREVDVRVTSFNAVKVWFNGKLIDEHEIYHGGSQMDQYISRATLQPGRNVILVKVCQNEQTQSWAAIWCFQLRVCDRNGTAILTRNP